MNNSDDGIIPVALAAYEKQEREDYDRFVVSMKGDGWEVVKDIFGADNFWRHTGTRRTVQHTTALEYFKITSSTPIPF